MDTPTNLQQIEVELLDAGVPLASVAMGILYNASLRQAYLSVASFTGTVNTITYNMPVDNDEHTLNAKFEGASFQLFVDGILRGSRYLTNTSVSNVSSVNLLQQPVVTGSTMSVSNISIDSCSVPECPVWVAGTRPSNFYVGSARACSYGANTFVNVGVGVQYSTNYGLTWTAATTLPSFGGAAAVYSEFGAGLFVTITGGGTGNSVLATSPTGIVWTTSARPTMNGASLTFTGGKFYMGGASGYGFILTSTDGINFSSVTMPNTNAWGVAASGNGIVIMVPTATAGGVCAISSNNGVSFSAGGTPFSAPYVCDDIAFANGVFVALGRNAAQAVYTVTSVDGIMWTSPLLTMSNSGYPRLLVSGGLFYVFGSQRYPTHSDNGLTWVDCLPLIPGIDKQRAFATDGSGKFMATEVFVTSNEVASGTL